MTRRKTSSKQRRQERRAAERVPRPDHDCRLVPVRCDGCGRVQAGAHATHARDLVAACPICGSETATYAQPL